MTTKQETRDLPPIAESIAVVQFRAEPERLQSLLLPPPLEPVGDGNIGYAIIGDAISAERRQSDPTVPIEATGFREAAVGMPCRYDGDQYVVSPILFLDRQTKSFEQGITRGIGTVTKSKWQVACEGRRDITAGDTAAGSASHGGSELFFLSIDIDDETTTDSMSDWVFDFLHYRNVSDPLADADAGDLANDMTKMELPTLEIGSLWEGAASLRFGEWRGGLLAGLVEEVQTGYHVTMGYEYAGERVLEAVDDWGAHIE